MAGPKEAHGFVSRWGKGIIELSWLRELWDGVGGWACTADADAALCIGMYLVSIPMKGKE